MIRRFVEKDASYSRLFYRAGLHAAPDRFDTGNRRHDMKPRWQHGRMYTARRIGRASEQSGA
jgi:hypothetical protein